MDIIFTVCSYNHIGRAFSLADSVAQNCPGTRFVIGLAGEPTDDFKLPAACEIVQAAEMGLPFLGEMHVKYNALELNSALKPYFAKYLLAHDPSARQIIFLDSDILLYQDITERVRIILADHSIILTPHATGSAKDGLGMDDRNFLMTGLFNAGFFAVAKDETGISFLEWWSGKLQDQCFIDIRKGMFGDQLWFNLVPLYFERVCILKDPGFNMAYWNMHNRKLSKKGTVFYVNEVFRLVFFHFSGADTKCFENDLLEPYQKKYTFTNRPDVRPLFEHYVASLKKHSFDKYNAYHTIGNNFKTKSKLLAAAAQVYRKVIKRVFYLR